jgi:hypothetical protein
MRRLSKAKAPTGQLPVQWDCSHIATTINPDHISTCLMTIKKQHYSFIEDDLLPTRKDTEKPGTCAITSLSVARKQSKCLL